MYFSNIINPELKHLQMIQNATFTMSLTDIINSDLFYVETVTSSMVRVFPLFYCNEISSTNPNDKIINNHCFIALKNNDTYLRFSRRPSIPIFYEIPLLKYLNIKKIDDDLTTAEFNAMVYLLRKQNILKSEINFQNTTAPDNYATYIFGNLDGQVKNDTGYIINDKIKQNPVTITLTDPVFINAHYTATFTVTSITGANLIEDTVENYIVKDTFTVELSENEPVALLLDNYENDSVLNFDFEVNIDFNVPEILNTEFEFDFTVSDDLIPFGDSITLTATLTGIRPDGYAVQFYEDGVQIDTDSTDVSGVASVVYTPTVQGIHNYSCSVLGFNQTITVQVGKTETTFSSFNIDKNIAFISDNINISAKLINADNLTPMASTPVILYNNNIQVGEPVNTDTNGEVTFTIPANTAGTYNIKVVYAGNEDYKNCETATRAVIVRRKNTSITINTNKTSLYYSEAVNITGVLKDELDNNIHGATVKLFNGNNQIAEYTTVNGAYEFNIQNMNPGAYQFKVVYDGDNLREGVTSNIKNVNVNKAPVNISINNTGTYGKGSPVQISLSSSYGNFTSPESVLATFDGQVTTVRKYSSTNYYLFTIPDNVTNDMYPLKINYTGNQNYASAEKTEYLNVKIVDNITISQNGNNIILNFKKNENNVAGVNVDEINYTFTGFPFADLTLQNKQTDADGNIVLSLSGVHGTGTVTAECLGLTSNTLNITL